MSSVISLKDRHTDTTRELILSTAIELLETAGVNELTIRAVARLAGMSERTVFRYYSTRDELLDAVASQVVRLMQTPPPPASINELIEFPDPLYHAFEARSALVIAGLHSEIVKRIRLEAAEQRWQAVSRLIDENAGKRSKIERKIASTNINYYLSASTWRYYRSNFDLSLEDTIKCAKTAIRLIVEDITAT